MADLAAAKHRPHKSFSRLFMEWHTARRSLGSMELSTHHPPQQKQEQLWIDLFSNPSDWWDNREDKRSPLHPDFRNKSSRTSLWLDSPYKPSWVDAHLVAFCSLPLQNATSHDDAGEAEIRVLCEKGLLDAAVLALSCIQHAASEGTYLSFLKACSTVRSAHHAKTVQEHLVRHGAFSSYIGNHLVVTLAKCGALEDAWKMLHALPHRTVISWTALISACVDCGKPKEALEFYQYMCEEGTQPNDYTYVSLLKACGSIPDLNKGMQLHADARKRGFTSDVFVGSILVSMYGRCGCIAQAETVFCESSRNDVVLCNSMLSAYAEQEEEEKALRLYRQMLKEGVGPSQGTFVSVLQACSILAKKEEAVLVDKQLVKSTSLEIGRALHCEVRRHGFVSNAVIGSTLVTVYGKSGSIREMESVFCGFCSNNAVPWNVMLSAHIEQGHGATALQLYRQMLVEGVDADEWTLTVALQACCSLESKGAAKFRLADLTKAVSLRIGKALHMDGDRKGCTLDIFVSNILMILYGKCDNLIEAESIFVELSNRNIVSWNTMLTAFVEQKQAEKALQLYRQLHEEGLQPEECTLLVMLQACTVLAEKEELVVVDGRCIKPKSLQIGQALHADAQKKGVSSHAFVGNGLMIMYNKCGYITGVESVFFGLSECDRVSWTAMLSAYVEHGQGEKSLKLCKRMQKEGVSQDDVMLVSILQACSETGSVEICRHIHFLVLSSGYDSISLVTNTLVHAYASCASIGDAQAVFSGLSEPGFVPWNALITGYAQDGNLALSLQTFEKMQLAGIEPDGVTFLSLISACSHAGLVSKAVEYFESMQIDHGLEPGIKHYGSMVDLLGRAGDFRRVECMLSEMRVKPDLAFWLSLLRACQVHANFELAKQAYDQAVHLQPKDSAAYILMSNIYVNAGLQDSAEEVNKSLQEAGAIPRPDQSCIEHDQEVYTFIVKDCTDAQHDMLLELLRELVVTCKKSATDCISNTLGVTCKEEIVTPFCSHSVMLALVFGLLNILIERPIQVRKSSGMCKDCHAHTSLISGLEGREIIIIDSNRVHRFKSGKCSCGD